ncbi:hypothetical protein ACIBK8_29420 [Streptomyces sp. NPDC050161]|uniref:hypothetical protein n=1 Tax=Streptomyces sp. NPDC050161 TaxID=3365604 RepID=UPI00378DCD18
MSLPRPDKPDYTMVFVEPVYAGHEPYTGAEHDDEEPGTLPATRGPAGAGAQLH